MRRDQVSHWADKLEKQILNGDLQPGDRLPSERDLSETWSVSRSVVREVLGRLASRGLVRSQHGSGAHVQAPTSRPIEMGFQHLLARAEVTLEHLLEVRLPLETQIAGLAAERRNDEHLKKLADTQAILGDSAAPLKANIEADLAFHAALAEATGNPLFTLVLEPIQKLLLESRRHTIQRYGSEIPFAHHAEILKAVVAQDAAKASQTMQQHLETSYQHLRQLEG